MALFKCGTGTFFRGPINISMLFKCGTCTFVMDSNVHRPCEMCCEENPKRIPLDRWDVVNAEDYNSLFPLVAEFMAANGGPTNKADADNVLSCRVIPASTARMQANPLIGKKSAGATAKSNGTSAPQKKKRRTLQPMFGEKMKRAMVTDEK